MSLHVPTDSSALAPVSFVDGKWCLDVKAESQNPDWSPDAKASQNPAWSPDAKAYPKPRAVRSKGGCDATPLKVELTSMNFAAPADVNVDRQLQIQLATCDLQAAIAKWELATQHLHPKPCAPKTGGSPTSKRAGAPVLQTVNEEVIPSDGGDPVEEEVIPMRGMPAVVVPKANATEVLHNVVSGLLDVAKTQLTVGEAPVADEDHANMMLRQCLEEEQAKSMKKINFMMQAQASAPRQPGMDNAGMNGGMPPAGMCGHPSMGFGMGGGMPPAAALGFGQQMPSGWGQQMPYQNAGVPFGAYGTLGEPMWAFQAQARAQAQMQQALAATSTQRQSWPPAQAAAQTHGVHMARPTAQEGAGSRRMAFRDWQAKGMKGRPPPKQERSSAEQDETLRTHLRELQKTDPRKVLIVRKINRIGFNSPKVLESHYSKYGPVQQVCVAHSYIKATNRRCQGRLRPSGLGFLVMVNSSDVEAILQDGDSQHVAGCLVKVQRFEQRSLEEMSRAAEESAEELAQGHQ